MCNHFCVELHSPEFVLGKTISAREWRQGVSRRKKSRGNPEHQITLRKLVHIMFVVLVTTVVTPMMVDSQLPSLVSLFKFV